MKPEFYTISKKQIFSLLQSGLKTHRLFAPMPRKKSYSFEEVKSKDDFKKIAFEYDTTILPPKKVFFPSEEVMFEYKKNKVTDWSYLRKNIGNIAERYLLTKLKRRPLVLPVVIEV